MTGLRVLVVTIVHRPADTRIAHRQIRTMLDAGWKVEYAAPFSAFDVEPDPDVTPIDLPRALGRRRLRAILAARRVIAERGGYVDLVLVHDPELLLALPMSRLRGAVVWDVHEDTVAAVVAKPWMPAVLRPIARGAVRVAERRSERRMHLLLAETAYRKRFRKVHPVVPNTPTYVPERIQRPGSDRVVYVGHLSRARGVDTLIASARLLARVGVRMDVVGNGDAYARAALTEAADADVLRWHGYVPNDRAMELVDGALCGLSLLRDLPNYRHSMPTKVLEYMARGVPVVTTPLAPAVSMVEVHNAGVVVPFDDPAAVLEAVLRLRDDEPLRASLGAAGHSAVRANYHWPDVGAEFLARLRRWAREAGAPDCHSLGTG